MKYILFTTIALILMLPYVSHAVVIRHDVDDAKYLADVIDFPALATFYIDGAHGTLIHPTG
jgi:hypothetical protein